MTQSEAESVKDLAKSTIEALEVIMGNMEQDCPNCVESSSFYDGGTKYCPICSGTRKVIQQWKWKPEIGQFSLSNGKVYLITNIDDLGNDKLGVAYCAEVRKENVTPILSWETIERVLDGVGYNLHIGLPSLIIKEAAKYRFQCNIGKDYEHKSSGLGKSRQEAVMKAVIKLGKKEEKNDSKIS